MITLVSSLAIILGISILFFFVFSQMSWWLFGEKFFPSIRLCSYVHRNYQNWYSKQRKILKHLQPLTVFGFLSTLLLMGIIPLNVAILAQIWEVFLPPGETVTVPLLGEYGSFPLITGILYALVEVAFSALYEYRKKLKQQTRAVAWIIVILILVEAGLSLYRTVIMESGATLSKALLDKVIGIGGPILAAFMGIVVPLALVFLSWYAILDFVIPIVQNAVIILRFIFVNLSISIFVLLFGWHPKRPIVLPGSIVRFRDIIEKLKHKNYELSASLEGLKKLYPELKKQAINDPTKLENELVNFTERVDKLEGAVNKESKDEDITTTESSYFAAIQNKRMLQNSIASAKKKLHDFNSLIRSNEHSFEMLAQQTLEAKKAFSSWRATCKDYEAQYEIALSQQTRLAHQLTELKVSELCEALSASLQQKRIDSGMLSEIEAKELHEFVNPATHLPKWKKEMYKMITEKCRVITDTAKSELVEIHKDTKTAGEWLAAHQIEVNLDQYDVDENHFANIERQLEDLDNRMIKSEETIKDIAFIMKKDLQQIALQMWAIITWLKIPRQLHKWERSHANL